MWTDIRAAYLQKKKKNYHLPLQHSAWYIISDSANVESISARKSRRCKQHHMTRKHSSVGVDGKNSILTAELASICLSQDRLHAHAHQVHFSPLIAHEEPIQLSQIAVSTKQATCFTNCDSFSAYCGKEILLWKLTQRYLFRGSNIGEGNNTLSFFSFTGILYVMRQILTIRCCCHASTFLPHSKPKLSLTTHCAVSLRLRVWATIAVCLTF